MRRRKERGRVCGRDRKERRKRCEVVMNTLLQNIRSKDSSHPSPFHSSALPLPPPSSPCTLLSLHLTSPLHHPLPPPHLSTAPSSPSTSPLHCSVPKTPLLQQSFLQVFSCQQCHERLCGPLSESGTNLCPEQEIPVC